MKSKKRSELADKTKRSGLTDIEIKLVAISGEREAGKGKLGVGS